MNRDRLLRSRMPAGPYTAMLVIACLAVSPLPADGPPMSGGDFEVVEYTVEGAGGAISGGVYSAHASLAQTDAHSALEGDAYALEGGFWPGGKGAGDTVFKDGFE